MSAVKEKKVKNIKVLDGVTLESTESSTQAATSRDIVSSYESDQLNFTVRYTTGSGETTTNCYVKVWGYVGTYTDTNNFPYDSSTDSNIASDSNNWIQLGYFDVSTGTATFTAYTFKVSGGAGGTEYDAHFALGVTFSKLRFSAYEDNVSSNKGTLTLIASVQ